MNSHRIGPRPGGPAETRGRAHSGQCHAPRPQGIGILGDRSRHHICLNMTTPMAPIAAAYSGKGLSQNSPRAPFDAPALMSLVSSGRLDSSHSGASTCRACGVDRSPIRLPACRHAGASSRDECVAVQRHLKASQMGFGTPIASSATRKSVVRIHPLIEVMSSLIRCGATFTGLGSSTSSVESVEEVWP